MILTCPECATSYFVDDLRIPRGGRMVRCSTCSARWRAYQERTEPEAEASADDLLAEERPLARPAPPDDDLEFVAAPVAPRRRTAPEPKRPIGLYVAAGAIIGLAALTGLAVLFRQQVAAVAPSTAPLFAAIGLPVNTTGLVIEAVRSQAVLEAGRPALSITGSVRNTRRATIQTPPIRISLLDKDGKAVTTTLYRPLNARVPPGARRYFAVSLPAPPAGLHDLEIGFEPGEAQVAPAAVTQPAGPAPVDAAALSPDSPDALHEHE